MYGKVYYIVYGFFFSLIVAAVLCLCLTIMQGVPHIDPIFFLMSFAVAFVTSFLVTSIIPLARIAAACAVYFDAKPDTVAFHLLQNVFFSTLIMFFLGLVMTAFMTGVGPAEAMNSMTGQMVETNLFDHFVSLCLQFWPTIVIVAMLSDPAAGGLAKLCVKPEKRYAKMPEGAAPGAPEAGSRSSCGARIHPEPRYSFKIRSIAAKSRRIVRFFFTGERKSTNRLSKRPDEKHGALFAPLWIDAIREFFARRMQFLPE